MSKNRYKNFNSNQSESEETMSENTSAVSSSITSSSTVSSSNVSSATTPVTSNVTVKKASEVVVNKPTEPVLTPNVKKIEKLLENYAAAVGRQSLVGNGKYDSIAVMISIVEYLNKTNDPAVFEYFFRYFQRNQRGIMYHDKALYGIHTIQNKLVKSRVSATHAAFTELCRVRSLQKGVFNFSINSMKIMGMSEILGRWIIEKSTNRK